MSKIIDKVTSKEEKVAQITSKTALFSAVAVAFITLLTVTLSEYIKKPAPNLLIDEREIKYFDNARKESNEQFSQNKNALVATNERIDNAITNEKDDELKSQYIKVKAMVESAIRTNQRTHKVFDSDATDSIEALRNGERSTAILLRKSANQSKDEENLSNEKIKTELQNTEVLFSRKFPRISLSEEAFTARYLEAVNLGSTTIRGINKSDPKKTMDEITKTYAD